MTAWAPLPFAGRARQVLAAVLIGALLGVSLSRRVT